MIFYIVSECYKLAPKEHKAWQDWVSKLIVQEIEIWPYY